MTGVDEGDPFRKVHYRVTAMFGGGLEVWVDPRDLKDGERQGVGHAAWCELWRNERDKWGNETKRPTPVKVMLQKLVNKMGVDAVKRQFVNAIQYERLD